MVNKQFIYKRKRNQFILSIFFILLLITGLIYPLLGFFAIICMFGGIIISFFRGRKWCDVCPRGAFWDSFIKPISKRKKIPKFFTNWYIRTFVILLLMTIFGIQIIIRWPNLYSIGFFLIVFLIITTIIGFFLGFFIHQRVWCRICPIGSMGNIIGKGKHQLMIDSKKCTECGVCAKVCPMQLNPSKYKQGRKINIVNEPDCIKCGLCVNSCPIEALKFNQK